MSFTDRFRQWLSPSGAFGATVTVTAEAGTTYWLLSQSNDPFSRHLFRHVQSALRELDAVVVDGDAHVTVHINARRRKKS